MNTATRRRLFVAAGIIVLAVIVMLAVVAGAGTAKIVSVAEALQQDVADERVQVTGTVVDDSFAFDDDVLTFDIYDPEGQSGQTLHVSYEGTASSTFGNGVNAICTGTVDFGQKTPTLFASEMVTQCPSKYESATEAINITDLLDYGDRIVDKTVRITGTVDPGTLTPAGASDTRFVLDDANDPSTKLDIAFDGGLGENIVDGTKVVLTGSLSPTGAFNATYVAQEG